MPAIGQATMAIKDSSLASVIERAALQPSVRGNCVEQKLTVAEL